MVGVGIGPELTGDPRALERLPWSNTESPDDPMGELLLYIFIIPLW